LGEVIEHHQRRALDEQSARRIEGQDGEPNLIVITGMSGAGRTEAMRAFEDMGFFCIDNLPPTLLMDLVTLAGLGDSQKRRLAVVCDIRGREFFSALTSELDRIEQVGIKVTVLFLDATNDVLLSRYKETRRRHPLGGEAKTISASIALERELLVNVRELADYVIDSSTTESHELRRRITQVFSQAADTSALSITVYSFGFKYGLPMESDLVMDVRFLPNPFYDSELRALSGLDVKVSAFVMGSPQTQRFMSAWLALLDNCMPGYVAEGKQHLLIALGCTGGQHRSVAIAEATAAHLRELDYKVTTIHRDLAMSQA
jgi:UPF0042 nucleotide-binding protein